MPLEEFRSATSSLMPGVMGDLAKLVSHASVAFPGFPPEPVLACHREVVDLLTRYGFEGVRALDLGAGYPAVWGEIPAPPGKPTVVLYGHYDVQPAPMEQGWLTDPWTLTERAGRFYGRGAADDKGGVVIHAATVRLFRGRPPVGIKLVIEGEEETHSHLEEYVAAHPEMFKADAFVIADMGNIVAGSPVLTTALRGDVVCTVEVRTLDAPLHSGVFGGPAPDALVALIRTLDSLWDQHCNTVVPGLSAFDWPGTEFPAELYREVSGIRPGVDLVGDGGVATRLWSKPNATVLGIDAPSCDKAANVLHAVARAKVGLRIAPGAQPQAELDKLMAYLRAHAPWNVEVDVQPVKAADAFQAPVGGPVMAAAGQALADAYGMAPSEVGSGGSIPLLQTLAAASPGAEFVLWGPEDAPAHIHGSNESVDPAEIERMIVAQALLLERL
jgi:acetylornithine deacetylase/succinyl-diaminopimelate desuccinylase-like protein